MKKEVRYFTHVNGFGDSTAFIRYRGPARGKRVSKDGSEHRSAMTLRQAQTAVKNGSWVEITEQQAKDLLILLKP